MKKLLAKALFYLMMFVNDKRAVVFDLMGLVMMIISILLANLVGGYISGYIGVFGALVGALIIGVVVYYLYSILVGTKTSLLGAIVFGVLNYVSTLVTGIAGARLGLSGGIVAILIQASVLSILWGYLGGKAQPQKTVKAPIKL